MATLFEQYVEEERIEARIEARMEEQKKGIKNIAEIYYQFKHNASVAKKAVMEKYPSVGEEEIDQIIDAVYENKE